jgi:hypothetical protein
MRSKEKIGVSLSVACAIHCVSFPFLVTLFPLFGASWFNETLEITLLGGSLVLAVFILSNDYR